MDKIWGIISTSILVLILAAIAIPSYEQYRQKALEAAHRQVSLFDGGIDGGESPGLDRQTPESGGGQTARPGDAGDEDGGLSGLRLLLVLLLSGGAIGGTYWFVSLQHSSRATQMIANSGAVSAQPFLRYDPNSVWGQAAGLRDQAYDALAAACGKLGIDALLLKSIDFTYPATASVDAWFPVDTGGATERVKLEIQIDPKPRSRYPFEYRVVCTLRGRMKTYGPFMPMTPETIEAWARYVFGKGPRLSPFDHRLQTFPWELWFAPNKVQGLATDPLTIALYIGVAVMVVGYMADLTFLWLPGLAVLLFCLGYRYFRRPLVINEGRPGGEPRVLRLVDSWQTMATGIGGEANKVRERMRNRLSEGSSLRINLRPENISYVTPDGKQEREQLVLSQGRGLVFVHVYRYGDDLYVGWDVHLNFGQWAEKPIRQGYDKVLGNPVVLNTVTPGVARVTEYDLIDLNSLTEWVHARVVQVTKDILAEHKLDQEIDFKIVRGERQSLLRNQEDADPRKTLFKRVAAAAGNRAK